MPPARIRNAVTTLILALVACSTDQQHRVQHPDEAAHVPQAPAGGVASEGPGVALAGEVTPEKEEDRGLLTECDKQGELCLPPAHLVDRLCRAAHVGTAIRLFAKSSPLTRGYVRMREVRAANLRGGPVGDANLTFAEEVLILAQHGGSGEMKVSGMGGFDVLRWDGTCATLSDEELVLQVPAPPRHAQFAWKYIDDSIQEVLLKNETIRSAQANERKRCRGMSSSQRSASCREAAERLNQHIVVAIRTGMDLPLPEHTP